MPHVLFCPRNMSQSSVPPKVSAIWLLILVAAMQPTPTARARFIYPSFHHNYYSRPQRNNYQTSDYHAGEYYLFLRQQVPVIPSNTPRPLTETPNPTPTASTSISPSASPSPSLLARRSPVPPCIFPDKKCLLLSRERFRRYVKPLAQVGRDINRNINVLRVETDPSAREVLERALSALRVEEKRLRTEGEENYQTLLELGCFVCASTSPSPKVSMTPPPTEAVTPKPSMTASPSPSPQVKRCRLLGRRETLLERQLRILRRRLRARVLKLIREGDSLIAEEKARLETEIEDKRAEEGRLQNELESVQVRIVRFNC